MYESKMALAVKANGRVLRENKDTVYLPFGCEFSLLVKNLNSVRAIVKIWIDGTDVTEGTSGLIVQPNDSVDLERFIKNGNLSAGNKFKFIERTQQISQHRGNKIDDGLIRVEFEFEQKKAPRVQPLDQIYRDPWHPKQSGPFTHDTWSGTQSAPVSFGSSAASASSEGASITSAFINQTQTKGMRSASGGMSVGQNAVTQTEVGITVAGAVSDQSFTWGAWFPTDGVKHSMVLRMLGEVEGEYVAAPVTVNHRPQCTSCGKVNKANFKFCSECGTGLQIV